MQPIKVTYTDSKLRILIEEYIAMQKGDFTFKEVCSYILYRAMEEGRTTTTGLYESNQLDEDDCKRVNSGLEMIDAVNAEGDKVSDEFRNDLIKEFLKG